MIIFAKRKKKVNIIKRVLIIIAALAAVAAVGTALMLFKRKNDAEKQKEAEIESEIEAVIEEKLAQIDTEEKVEE